MSTQNKTNKNPKIAPYQHPLWNALLWVLGYFVATCVVLVLFYIFREDIGVLFGSKDPVWTIENFIKVAIGIFGLFAFVVTIWRGNLHAQQVSSQVEQIELGREQLEITEDNNIAKLLVDGTKLLGSHTTKAEKVAGVACLAYIIQISEPFAEQAATSLQVFIEETAQENSNGIDIQTNELITVALDTLDKYAERVGKFINLKKITIINSLMNRHGGFWPNLRNITYRNFQFKNIIFNEQIANFYIENCTFFDCRIDSIARMEALPEIKENNKYNVETGETIFDFIPIYNYPSAFWGCVFDDGDQSDKNFMYIHTLANQRHKFIENCYYNDKYIRYQDSIDFFQSKKVRPLSSLTPEERLKVGPQTT